MTSKLQKYIKSIPERPFRPATNPMVNALIRAWAGADEELMTQLKNTKAQLFVKTAEGVYLDRLASNFGVTRPDGLGMLDEDFQKLIPNLSLKQKQITKSFYDTMDVFWGPLFSRTNLLSSNYEPFNISSGDSFTISIDGGDEVTITVIKGDIQVEGQATAAEMVRILNRIDGITAVTEVNVITGNTHINLRTDTPGPRGTLEIAAGSFNDLGFDQGVRHRITALDQRTVLYQVNPGEIIIELPAIVPTLRRKLEGSHHFHSDATLESAIPPATRPWVGSFLFAREESPFVITSTKAILEVGILKGSVLKEITVDDASVFPATGGELIFNFGKNNQENPVSFITVPNSKTILVDPGHSFAHTHEIGSEINLLVEGQTTPYVPAVDGSDYPIYLTSPANARSVVQDILESLTAAGITVTFVVLLPDYKYLFDNPFNV